VEYRPLLSNNIVLLAGASGLIPGQGFKDLYNNLTNTPNPLAAAFLELNLAY
jgi:hypothetical protein